MHRLLSLGSLTLTLLAAGSGAAEAGSASSGNALEAARAVDAFGLDLLQKLQKPGENLLISPLSVETALAMTYAGAEGETAAEMAQTLRFGERAGQVHGDFRALLGGLESAATKVSVANRLFGSDELEFKAPFLEATAVEYGAPLEKVSFRQDPEGARTHINGWVEERTSGRIKDLMPSGSIHNDTALALVNAVYFKGEWQQPFGEAILQTGAFEKSDGTKVDAHLMYSQGVFRYLAQEGLEAIELPYKGHSSMVILLPASSQSVSELTEKLKAPDLEALLAKLHATRPHHLALTLPKWTLSGPSIELKEQLSALGMTRVFDPYDADLTGIADPGAGRRLFVEHVMHQTFIAVTETGTEAAAATGVAVGTTSAPSVWFQATRPFIYAIRDDATGALLFLGKLEEPHFNG